MVALAAIMAVITWLSPLSFGLSANGWHTGHSATFRSVACSRPNVPTSTAWAANVAYRDSAAADPPNRTLQQLPATGVVVWASISACTAHWPPDHRRASTHLSLADAYRFACCEARDVRGGEWELYGFGPKQAYSVLVRIYWGAPPTKEMKAEATRALRSLHLPNT